MNSLTNLPEELQVHILLFLEPVAILRSIQTCHTLHDTITRSASIQYILELHARGLIDPTLFTSPTLDSSSPYLSPSRSHSHPYYPPGPPIGDRLAVLLSLERKWQTLVVRNVHTLEIAAPREGWENSRPWSQLVSHGLLNMAEHWPKLKMSLFPLRPPQPFASPVVWTQEQLFPRPRVQREISGIGGGGGIAGPPGNPFQTQQLPGHGQAQPHVTGQEPDFEVFLSGVDPSQDLLVLVYGTLGMRNGRGPIFALELRLLSHGTQLHPLAEIPILYSFNPPKEGRWQCHYGRIEISGDNLYFLGVAGPDVDEGGELKDSIVHVWDWKTGSSGVERAVYTQYPPDRFVDIHLLGAHAFLTTTACGVIELYSAHDADAAPGCIARFALPCEPRGLNFCSQFNGCTTNLSFMPDTPTPPASSSGMSDGGAGEQPAWPTQLAREAAYTLRIDPRAHLVLIAARTPDITFVVDPRVFLAFLPPHPAHTHPRSFSPLRSQRLNSSPSPATALFASWPTFPAGTSPAYPWSAWGPTHARVFPFSGLGFAPCGTRVLRAVRSAVQGQELEARLQVLDFSTRAVWRAVHGLRTPAYSNPDGAGDVGDRMDVDLVGPSGAAEEEAGVPAQAPAIAMEEGDPAEHVGGPACRMRRIVATPTWLAVPRREEYPDDLALQAVAEKEQAEKAKGKQSSRAGTEEVREADGAAHQGGTVDSEEDRDVYVESGMPYVETTLAGTFGRMGGLRMDMKGLMLFKILAEDPVTYVPSPRTDLRVQVWDV